LPDVQTEFTGGRNQPPGQGDWVNSVSVVLGAVIVLIALAFAYDLEILRTLEIPKEQALPIVLGSAFVIIFLCTSAGGKSPRTNPPWYDIALAAAGMGVCLYFAYAYNDLIEDFYFNRHKAFLVGLVIIPLIIEGLRRTAGWILVAVVCLFFVYAFLGHLVPGDLQAQEKQFYPLVAYLAADNVALFGLPMQIVTYVVVLFIFMGRLFLTTGASEWFTDLASALLGRSRGGSAKIAIFASALFGSISGSAVSNVASTGVITIPLMRRGGYNAKTAGALEAVASTGGQIMPPIMGAAAFLMAEFLEVEYTSVIIAALIPAILYYSAVFIQADLEAARMNIAPIPLDQIPPLLRVLKEGWFFVLPYVVLALALFSYNRPPDTAALYACVTLPIVSVVFGFKGKRFSLVDLLIWPTVQRTARTPQRVSRFATTLWKELKDICASLAEAGRSSVDIIIIGAMAGLIIGIVETTGLGHALSILLLKVGEGSLLLLLVLTAAISIVLGMGMPTTAIYVLLALMVAPPLIELGVDPLAAHLFVLYFGLMSMITPPVALAAFTGAKLAKANPMSTAVTACRIGWVAYVIPFVFVFSPPLIMKGGPVEVIVTFFTAVLGVWIASAGFLGYLFRRLGTLSRVIFITVGLALLVPLGFVEGSLMIRLAVAVIAVALLVKEFLTRASVIEKGQLAGRV